MTGLPLRLAGRVVGVAGITGLRSLAGPALLSRAAARGDLDGAKRRLFVPTWFRAALMTAAIGEMAADKSGLVPDRVETGPLAGRAAAGGLVGATLFRLAGSPWLPGAVLGSLAAIGGAYAGYNVRRAAHRKFGLPDPLLGLIEDGIVVGVGLSALSL